MSLENEELRTRENLMASLMDAAEDYDWVMCQELIRRAKQIEHFHLAEQMQNYMNRVRAIELGIE